MFWHSTAIGLDIDDRSIEAVELRRQGKKVKVVSLGRTVLEKGIVENGQIKQVGPLVSAVKETLAKAKPTPIVGKQLLLALPINQVYTATVKLSGKLNDVQAALRAEAHRTMPIPEEDLLFVFKSLGKTKEAENFLLIGLSRQLFNAWQDLAKKLKSPTDSFDLQLYALFRDLAVVDPAAPVVIVDLGAETTNILLFDNGTIQYSASLKLAGDHFTEAIAEHYGLEFGLAEVKKIRLGLNRQLFPVIEPLLAEVTGEIKRVVEYYQEKTGRLAAEILLSGGGSRLKGLPYYFSDNLPVTVRLAQSVLAPGDYPEFLGAIGIALRRLFSEKWSDEPLVSLSGTDRKLVAPAKLEIIKEAPLPKTSENVFAGSESAAAFPTDRSKTANELKLLAAILMIGVAAVGLTWWYKENNRPIKRYQQESTIDDLAVQTLPFRLIVNLQTAATTTDGVSGRIIEDKVETADSFAAAQDASIKRVQGQLSPGESLWREPLNEVISTANLKWPLTLRWLAYNDADGLALLLKKIEPLSSQPISYLSWSKDKLIKGNSLSQVYLEGSLTIAAIDMLDASALGSATTTALVTATSASTTVSALTNDSTVEVTNGPSAASTTVTETKAIESGDKVLVGQTETGFLNVRSAPTVSGELLAKVNPGEIYEVVSVGDGWIQLKLSDGTVGWAAARYLLKQ